MGGRRLAPEETPVNESTTRLEAYSDGVFAIASTLLILELRLPEHESGRSLFADLLSLWPSYFAFGLSFFVILVSWVTHHDLLRLIRGTSHWCLLANGCVLIYITFIPFPTAVLASHLGGPETTTAVAFYCGTFVLGSGAFNFLVAAISRGQLCHPDPPAQAALSRIRRAYRVTFATYVAATALAFVVPYLALALNIAVRVVLLRIRSQVQRAIATSEMRAVAREGASTA
jgi:uncharacterized membrane protein